jgi:hypothetical protein
LKLIFVHDESPSEEKVKNIGPSNSSWHVLKKDNLKIVHGDEQKRRIEQERKEAKALAAEKEFRLKTLKRRAGIDEPLQEGHVELIVNEEYELTHTEIEKQNTAKFMDQFTMRMDKTNADKPWYATNERRKDNADKPSEAKRKMLEDPLAEFSKRAKADKQTPSTSTSQSIDKMTKLRKEKAERERKERERERKLVSKGSASSGYYSQYHPELHRRK